MQPSWHPSLFCQSNLPPFALLETLFSLSQYGGIPSVTELNRISPEGDVSFVCQDEVSDDAPYYELYIDQTCEVPTRKGSWHDLFNALIWRSFPKSKSLLNRLHVEQIREHGLHPRTRLRNHLTHFDECGVVLVTKRQDLLAQLREHQWAQVFFENRSAWGSEIVPLVFGHANLEMLLNPFIGLTGKWLALPVDDECDLTDTAGLLAWADSKLAEEIAHGRVFEQAKPLYPLPLLGIPGWTPENTELEYYQNKEYFRPKR